MLKVMNHTEYQKKVKKLSDDVLKYIIKDCQEVINLQKDFNPNLGYYADEISYCAAELKRRKDLKKKIKQIIESYNVCDYCLFNENKLCGNCYEYDNFQGKKVQVIK